MKPSRDSYDIRGTITLGSMHQDRQYTAATAILRRLYHPEFNEPGVILADEVGLGKTYVAYGVVAWLLRKTPRSRVLVLTNSKNMMTVWKDRWDEISFPRGEARPEAKMCGTWEEFRKALRANRLMVSSYETLKNFRSGEDDEVSVRASLGQWLFQAHHYPTKKRLSSLNVALLKAALGIDRRRRVRKPKRKIPVEVGRQFFRKHFNWSTREWKNPGAAAEELDGLEIQYGAS